MGQIERILQLVQQNKINREDAAKLLSALSSGLATLPDSTWERLFAMLDQGMSVEALAQVLGAELEQDKDNRRSTWSTKGARVGSFGMGGLGSQVSTIVNDQIADAFRKGFGDPRRKTARVLRVVVEASDGTDVNINIPLGLANMVLKLIPKEAQRAMTEQGIDPATLQELLKSELPDGEIIRVEASDGTEVRISIE
jgi:hypothetical protein